MKKASKLIAILLVAFIATTEVHASDLTSVATANDSLGGVTDFEFTYDSTNDINNLLVKLTVNETLINTVLSQAPGNASSAASLGRFVFTLNPGLDRTGYTFKKNRVYYSDSVLDAKALLDPTINGETPSNYSSVWPVNLNIQYYDGTAWQNVTDQSNGGKTIKTNLLEKLSITESELKYGENFRFFIDESESILWGFEPIGPNGSEQREYISISYKTNFPISAVIDGNNVYYPTLQGAISSGAEEVIINDNIETDEDVVIPEGLTLTINESASLKLSGTATLTNNGVIDNKGEIRNDNNAILYLVTVKSASHGNVIVSKQVALFEQEVELTITPDDDYELKTLKVVNVSTGQEVVVTNEKFVMPESDVEVTATFEKVELPPKTGDNVMLYVILGIITLFGFAFAINKVKKQFN